MHSYMYLIEAKYKLWWLLETSHLFTCMHLLKKLANYTEL